MTKTFSTRVALATCLTIGTLSPAWADCDAPETTLSLGLVQAPDRGHPSYAAAEIFKTTVEQGTGCKVQIDLFPSGQLGGDREMFEALTIGTQDIGFISPPPMSAFTTTVDVLSLPWLFSGDLDLMYQVLTSQAGADLLDAIDSDVGTIQSLSYLYSPFRNFVTSKPVQSVDDLQGLKLRTMQSNLNIETFSAVGANPTPIPFPEVYGAMQTGVVDGFETDVVGMYSGKFQEVAKNVTVSGHFNNVPIVVMNLMSWDALDAETQDVLQKAADEAGKLSYERSVALIDDYTQRLKDEGVEFYEIDTAALAAEMDPIYEKYATSDSAKAFVEAARTAAEASE
ncbi:TRAP transporter substrate-binding protein [Paracoccus sp. SCSIO 75233]|uniref:TRAP transporter substrate-binding protein n=1 Tax=Paracoccus sp. SCSIO 75233 TaxID=3017782 RepID=UPI0022F1376E|nr:TRAP transporter substrate-binding protein [Paracoccus sp. SCSIO 75233]WBU52029.1 TRAP transporter substrate-binding protein [Paracoccus sp. SCSIO 75233]